VDGAKRGDPEAIRYLYATFAGTVHRHVARMLGETDAEDVTQTVFLRLMTGIGSYQRREASFEAWLLHVARNSAVDHLRRLRTHATVLEVAYAEPGPEAAAPSGDERVLWSALETLPPAQRQVAVLRLVIGFTAAETARLTRRTEASVNNLNHRARIALQEALIALGAAPTATARRAAARSRLATGAVEARTYEDRALMAA
jgi:RNA polymerase sigma-70 factor (ECF subfamily)